MAARQPLSARMLILDFAIRAAEMSSPEGAPLRFAPMSLVVMHEPFDHDDFIFELKYDGFRALAHVDRGGCRLISRNCHEFETFPELSAAVGQAMPGQFILDGEIVYLGKDGRHVPPMSS
jgi:bifunctional non-homologous end joining protein LigD